MMFQNWESVDDWIKKHLDNWLNDHFEGNENLAKIKEAMIQEFLKKPEHWLTFGWAMLAERIEAWEIEKRLDT